MKCSIGLCEKPAHARGWCHAHYDKWWRLGSPHAGTVHNVSPAPCGEDGCGQSAIARGLCSKHYKRLRYRMAPSRFADWARAKRLRDAGTKPPRQRDREQRRTVRANRRAREYGAVGSHTTDEWRRKLAEYRGCCVYCGERADSRDHYVPLARGGTNGIDNIVPACITCNKRKQDKMPDEYRAVLMRQGAYKHIYGGISP